MDCVSIYTRDELGYNRNRSFETTCKLDVAKDE